MNPFAYLLVALALAGPLVARRRPAGWAWLAVGLAATALLAPALALRDGVPSPAAILGEHAPWQGELDPRQGNAALSDVAYQIQPWLHFQRQELRAGRLPLWNPYQDAGVPLWANGQSAPLFPLHLLFAALPEVLGWLLLPWLKVMIGGLGAWWLGRQLGLSPPAALVAAVAFPLAGMPAAFLLYPLGSAVALAPWVLAAVERVAAGRWGLAPLALVAGLQLLAGHPETCLHTAMLSALYLLVRGTPGVVAWRAWGRLLGGWLGGAALAAAHLLPFVVHLRGSSRWLQEAAGGTAPASLLLAQPLRLVLPDLYGNPAHGTWWGPFFYSSTAVYAGAATLVLAVAGLAAAGRRPAGGVGGGAGAAAPAGAVEGGSPAAGGGDTDAGPASGRRWLAVAALLAFSLAAAYHLAGLRQALAMLPLVERALHHRLLFAVDLALALLAGAGLDRWRRGGGRGALAGAALAAALLAAAWAAFAGEWAVRGLLAGQGWQTAWVAAAALLLAAALLVPRRLRPRLAWLLPLVVAADLVAAHGAFNPGLSHQDLFPETRALRFLHDRDGRVIATGTALRPNAATVYRLADARGDDTLRPARVEAFAAAALGAGHPTYFVPVTRWDPAALDRLAVRWVLTGPDEPSPVAGARLAYEGPDARVWERREAPSGPHFVAADAPDGDLAGCFAHQGGERLPARRSLEWRCKAPATLNLAETFDPGWSARVDGRRVPLVALEDRFLAVRLPAGGGRIDLEYRPVGLAAGAATSLAAALALAGLALAGRVRGRPARYGRRSIHKL